MESSLKREELLEDLIVRFKESERRTEEDTKTRQYDTEKEKKKLKKREKKQWKDLERQENVRG